MNDENDLVTALSTSNPMEANVIKSKLEAEGIPCFIADQNTVTINPLYTNALGGVRIQVRLGDLVKVREVLGLDNQTTSSAPTCPQCHSQKITYKKLPGLLNIVAFLGLGAFFPKLKRQWNCGNCRHTWQN